MKVVIKSFSIPADIAERLEKIEGSKSEIVSRAIKTYLTYYSLEPGELKIQSDQNYVFLAKTRWGKTYRVKHLIHEVNKQLLIIDPHGEYDIPGFNIIEERYHQRIPLVGEEIYRLVKSQMWPRIDHILQKIKKGNHILRPVFTDYTAEKLFVTELLKELLQYHIQTKKQRLLVVEEAARYQDGLLPVFSQGLKNGLQVIAISQFPLDNEILLNSTLILGYLWRSILRDTPLPEEITDTLLFLKPHEFVFFDFESNSWKILRELGNGEEV